MGVNSQALNTPLNHIIWLNDYKTYGKDSYVFQNNGILEELYRSPISLYDNKINQEAFDYLYATYNSNIGSWFANLNGGDKSLLFESNTAEDVLSNLGLDALYTTEYNIIVTLFKNNDDFMLNVVNNTNILKSIMISDNINDFFSSTACINALLARPEKKTYTSGSFNVDTSRHKLLDSAPRLILTSGTTSCDVSQYDYYAVLEQLVGDAYYTIDSSNQLYYKKTYNVIKSTTGEIYVRCNSNPNGYRWNYNEVITYIDLDSL